VVNETIYRHNLPLLLLTPEITYLLKCKKNAILGFSLNLVLKYVMSFQIHI